MTTFLLTVSVPESETTCIAKTVCLAQAYLEVFGPVERTDRGSLRRLAARGQAETCSHIALSVDTRNLDPAVPYELEGVLRTVLRLSGLPKKQLDVRVHVEDVPVGAPS